MTPYASQLWHWFGRGQLVLLVLNALSSDLRGNLGETWTQVRWENRP